ncbi:hypothetical protein VKT23_012865 [Stygiomarasmius scandens]|uniref:CHAT domain-containing protein n=1 Tax=Marasmiellus scandens TaxID=2682957 RepID=A0ABR1J524_9AGAR
MSNSDIPPGNRMDSTSVNATKAYDYTQDDNHDEEEIELQIGMKISLDQQKTADNISLDPEEQAELDQALHLSELPLSLVDERIDEIQGQKYSSLSDGDIFELCNSGVQLAEDFGKSGDISEIQSAVRLLEAAVYLTPDDHATKPTMLSNLGAAFQSQFSHLGVLNDIEKAIGVLQKAVDLTPDEHANKPGRLNNLGTAFRLRFSHLGELNYIEKAIGILQEAADLTPDSHIDKPGMLSNLAGAFQSRFAHLGELNDIENAIGVSQKAVDLTPDGHAEKPVRLNNLGTAFQSRFEHLGELNDIETAIGVLQKAVDLIPDGHADKPGMLNNLGTAFQSRFEHLGKLNDIEKAISVKQKAVDLTPDGHVNKPAMLNNLGNAFQSQFSHLGGLNDIEKAIGVLQKAVDLTPDGHADKPGRLSNLGSAFQSKYSHLGKLNDIEKAIGVLQKAVDLTPDGHADKPARLSILGTAFQSQFLHFGEVSDIEKAIGVLQTAVDLTPDSHVNKPAMLSSLGTAFESKFSHLSELNDIEEAIGVLQKAVDLTPDGHADKPGMLNNLGAAFQSQFSHLGELNDIEKAIGVFQKAVDLTPDGHADKPGRLSNLGTAFRLRFSHLGELNDIEKATSILQKAVDLTPDGHAGKPGRLNNLGNAFQSQFSHLGNLNDIEKAIGVLQKAVDLTPDDHADKPRRLSNLAGAFQSRFLHLGEVSDIERVIDVMEKAVDLTPDGHANKPGMLSNLGNAFHLLFTQCKKFLYLSQACSAYQNASMQPSGPSSIKLQAARLWARYSSSADLAMSAYTRFLELIPQVVWLGQTIQERYKDLPLIGSTINAATAAAISVNDLQKAIEWSEEGHSIIWGQIIQLRSPVDQLYDHHPQLADDLKRISRILESSGTSRGDGNHKNPTELNMSMEQEAQQHHKMARKYEDLVQQIRSCEGFSDFFKPKTFPELVPAASNGPVIILNSHSSQSDALILCGSGNAIHVPLPVFSSNEAERLQSRLALLLEANHVRKSYQNPLKPVVGVADNLQSVLADLWSFVVQPILPELEGLLWEITHDNLPHITWCATGPLAFLPLHAAGIYGSDDVSKDINVSDFAVSSYTTTLTAMLGNHSKTKQAGKESSRTLIISQPATPKHQLLPGTEEEATVVQKHTSPEHTLHLSHTEATVAEVVQAMNKYNIVHLACHGIQDPNPLESAFALYDGKLNLKTLMGMSLDNAELAFLSACQTATGDKNLPDEAVHLAAGMLAVGYPSVIATMWSIGDREAPMVADKVYQNLFGSGLEDQGKKLAPAYALHKAIKHLRAEVGEMNFVKWVPFVHFGV